MAYYREWIFADGARRQADADGYFTTRNGVRVRIADDCCPGVPMERLRQGNPELRRVLDRIALSAARAAQEREDEAHERVRGTNEHAGPHRPPHGEHAADREGGRRRRAD